MRMKTAKIFLLAIMVAMATILVIIILFIVLNQNALIFSPYFGISISVILDCVLGIWLGLVIKSPSPDPVEAMEDEWKKRDRDAEKKLKEEAHIKELKERDAKRQKEEYEKTKKVR